MGQPSLPPYGPMIDRNGNILPVWYAFFLSLYGATGGGGGGGAPVLTPVTGADFSATGANFFFAGPTSGGSATPTFRTLVSSDLNSVAGSIPGINSGAAAPAGDVGEYQAANITVPVALTSGVVADIGSGPLTAGDWDVWAAFATLPAGGAAQTLIKAWLSETSATDPGAPNGGAYLAVSGGSVTQAQCFPVGAVRTSLAVTTTVYLSAAVTYSGGSLGGYGFLAARRRR